MRPVPLNRRVDSFQDSHLVLNPQALQYMISEFYTTEDIKLLQLSLSLCCEDPLTGSA